MNMQHDLAEDEGADEAVDDLSTLAWVHDELRRSLETAHKSLRRYLKDAATVSGSDVDAVDPSVLRTARAQLHQGVGALEMIGLLGPARVLSASEAAVQRFIARPKTLNAKAIETIESASFGVLDYLNRKLAGKGLPTLALFPQYRALQELVGADRVHPADLWRDEWQWHDIGAPVGVAPRAADLADTFRDGKQCAGHHAQRRPCRDGPPERAVRRPRRRCRRPSGRVVAPGRGLLRRPGGRAVDAGRLCQARQLAAARAAAHEHRRHARDFRSPGAGRVVLLRARAFACRPARRTAAAGRARGLPARRRGGVRLPDAAPGPLRPGVDRPGAQARGRRQGRLVGRGRRRGAPHERPGRAVHAGRRLAASPVPVGRAAGRCAAGGRQADRGCGADAQPRAGHGSGHQRSVPRRLARGRRVRPSADRHARAAPGAAHPARRRRAGGAASGTVDGGAVPPRVRAPDHGQRGAGTARHLVRGGKADRPVLPRSGAARTADSGAEPAAGDARRAVGAGHGARLAGGAAHARRCRCAGRDRGRCAAAGAQRRLRSPGRQPGRAELHDRHAQRAAADGALAVQLRCGHRQPDGRDGAAQCPRHRLRWFRRTPPQGAGATGGPGAFAGPGRERHRGAG